MNQYGIIRIDLSGTQILYAIGSDWIFKQFKFIGNKIKFDWPLLPGSSQFLKLFNKEDAHQFMKKYYSFDENYYLISKEQYEKICSY